MKAFFKKFSQWLNESPTTADKILKLNLKNGELQFEECAFNPEDKLSNIKLRFSSEEFEEWIINYPWETYRLNISSRYILILRFYSEHLHTIEIYPKPVLHKSNSQILQEVLRDFGGEDEYNWGEVGYNVDIKAGYESVFITYL